MPASAALTEKSSAIGKDRAVLVSSITLTAFSTPRHQLESVKDQILIDRLRIYETLLQEQGIDPSKLPVTPDSEPRRGSSHTAAVVPNESQLQTPSSIESEPSRDINKTQVVHGQGRSQFVDK